MEFSLIPSVNSEDGREKSQGLRGDEAPALHERRGCRGQTSGGLDPTLEGPVSSVHFVLKC